MRFMWAQVRACLLVAAAAVTAAAPERLFKLRLQEERCVPAIVASGACVCPPHCSCLQAAGCAGEEAGAGRPHGHPCRLAVGLPGAIAVKARRSTAEVKPR